VERFRFASARVHVGVCASRFCQRLMTCGGGWINDSQPPLSKEKKKFRLPQPLLFALWTAFAAYSAPPLSYGNHRDTPTTVTNRSEDLLAPSRGGLEARLRRRRLMEPCLIGPGSRQDRPRWFSAARSPDGRRGCVTRTPRASIPPPWRPSPSPGSPSRGPMLRPPCEILLLLDHVFVFSSFSY
jgi:hypothetical protein